MSDLDDRKALNSSEYAKYINNNPEPEEFFESLKHENDRFSYINSDYVALQNSLQGIVASNGVEFGLSLMSDGQSVFGYVRYIHENSDASDKNIERGDVFIAVDGQDLNVNNYEDLLYGDNLTYTLHMASISENTISSNGETVELTKVENFEKNSIHISKSIDDSRKKILYLMYTKFVNNFNNIPNEYAGRLLRSYVFDFAIDGVRFISYVLFCSVILFGFNAPGELPKRPTSCAGMLFAVIFLKSPDVAMLNSFAMLRFSEHSPLDESTMINSLQPTVESLFAISELLSSQLQ